MDPTETTERNQAETPAERNKRLALLLAERYFGGAGRSTNVEQTDGAPGTSAAAEIPGAFPNTMNPADRELALRYGNIFSYLRNVLGLGEEQAQEGALNLSQGTAYGTPLNQSIRINPATQAPGTAGRNLFGGVNSASYLNPLMGLAQEQIKREFVKRGLDVYYDMSKSDLVRAAEKLKIIDEMEPYCDAILNEITGRPMYVDEGFQRKAFDVFVKTNKTSDKGVPLDQTYRYIPKSIPEARVKFDGKLYTLIQGGTKMTMKIFRDIERIALKGGDYSAELQVMRNIKQNMEKRETPANIVFKSRKF